MKFVKFTKLIFITALALMVAAPMSVIARDNPFVIQNGVLTKYTGSDSKIEIPENVESIGEFAFTGNSSITEVTIPNSVKAIGESAFSDCDNLESVSFESGLQDIGYRAFSQCTKLASVILPDSLTKIGNLAFYHCDALNDVTLPTSNVEYGGSIFARTPWIKNYAGDYVITPNDTLLSYIGQSKTITLPSNVKVIAPSAFSVDYDASPVTNVTIPGTVKVIDTGAFMLSKVKTVIIKSGVQELKDNAFAECNNLRNITIPKSVTKIGKGIFSSEEGKTKITVTCTKNSAAYKYAKLLKLKIKLSK